MNVHRGYEDARNQVFPSLRSRWVPCTTDNPPPLFVTTKRYRYSINSINTISHHYNLVSCSQVAENEFNPSYTVRMLPAVRDVVGAIFSLFKHFRWKYSVTITVGKFLRSKILQVTYLARPSHIRASTPNSWNRQQPPRNIPFLSALSQVVASLSSHNQLLPIILYSCLQPE